MWTLLPATWEPREGVDRSPHPVFGERVRPRLSRWTADEATLAVHRAEGRVPVLTVPGEGDGPVVLVTMDRRGPPGAGVAWIGEDYVRAVLAVGARPRLVPPGERAIDALLAGADALVITGGAFDIHPHHYGQPVTARIDRVEEDRTALELALARAALQAGLPVLGVCGGMQVLAVAAGGSLIQDLPAEPSHEQPTDPAEPWHPVRVTGRGLVLFEPTEAVNSTHHQAVDQPGAGMEIVGVSDDGVAEVITHRHHPFAWGVQWHPERLGDLRPYAALAKAARGATWAARRAT